MRGSWNCGICGTLKVVIGNGTRRCMPCSRRRGREYYHKSLTNRDNKRRSHLRRRYGIALEALKELFDRQLMACAICRKHWRECVPAKRVRHEESFLQYLCVDHDHRSGRVRGLLCNACNTAIGLFEEDIERLKTAIAYVESQQISLMETAQPGHRCEEPCRGTALAAPRRIAATTAACSSKDRARRRSGR
jgi:hypothetical protein